jgi:hypothetical protein
VPSVLSWDGQDYEGLAWCRTVMLRRRTPVATGGPEWICPNRTGRHVDGMEGVRGSNPLSSTAFVLVRAASSVPVRPCRVQQ